MFVFNIFAKNELVKCYALSNLFREYNVDAL